MKWRHMIASFDNHKLVQKHYSTFYCYVAKLAVDNRCFTELYFFSTTPFHFYIILVLTVMNSYWMKLKAGIGDAESVIKIVITCVGAIS